MMHNISSAQTDADNFYRSDAVTAEKVSFPNQYKMKVGANLFRPKEMKPGEKRPAIIVGHPMGAVKEQAANLYAIKMAERGFVTLAIDLSFWGDSEGEPRNTVSPEIYAEDFSAAADFLGTREFVERSGIGAIGICGSGSFAVSAAKIDPRLKAVATVSMYDMGAASRSGLMKPGAILINSSRGAVVDGEALLRSGLGWALDVWEHEPHLDPALLENALLATPHIAGYSEQGKANATAMSVASLARRFGLPLEGWYPPQAAPARRRPISWQELCRTIGGAYDIASESRSLKERPGDFESMRDHYAYRREYF